MEGVHRSRGSRAMYGLVCALCLLLMAVPCPGWGQAQGRGSSANSELLLADEQTIITASKSVQRVRDAPAAVTVITEEQLREEGAVTLLDALRYATGVDVFEENASTANVSIRGFNSQYANKLLVMVDGRSIYQDFFGGVFWHSEPLLLSNIKRIEIVRGPGSALYGANAFNGIINIITKTPAELAVAPEKVTTRLYTGDRNTQLLESQIAIGSPKGISGAIGVAYNHTDGLGGTGPQRKLYDSYSTPTATLDLEKRLPQGTLRFSAGTANSVLDETETISIRGAHNELSYLNLNYAEDSAKNPLLVRMYGNFSRQNAENIHYNNTQTANVEIQQERSVAPTHNLVYGGSYRYISGFSDLTGPQNHAQSLLALYLQDEWHFARPASLFAGVRLDHHSLFGTDVSPRISAVYHLPQAQTLRATFGSAFRDPVLEESYTNQTLPTSPVTTLHLLGSAQLKPEQVLNYELGYRKELKRGFVGASLFYNQVFDQIGFLPTAFLPSPPAPPFTPSEIHIANLGNASVFGVELETQNQITGNLRVLANYAYQDLRMSHGQLFSIVTPKHKINAGVNWKFARMWDAFLGAHFAGSADVYSGQSKTTLNAYARVDVRVGYRFGTTARPWNLSVIAQNLFDDHHLEYPTGIPVESGSPRRTVFFALQGGF